VRLRELESPCARGAGDSALVLAGPGMARGGLGSLEGAWRVLGGMVRTQESLEPSPWLTVQRRGRGVDGESCLQQHAPGCEWALGGVRGRVSGLRRVLWARTACGGSEVRPPVLCSAAACSRQGPSSTTRRRRDQRPTTNDQSSRHAAYEARPGAHGYLLRALALWACPYVTCALTLSSPKCTAHTQHHGKCTPARGASTCSPKLTTPATPLLTKPKSSWHALNVEPENEEQVEIDDTKEIQIEEALKLYQTALKLHSEGPQSFERAAEAYKALFESEIFKYQESLSEYKRHELFGDELVFDSILDDFDAGPVQAAGGTESAPNTLPQLLHLSYKNHGQFILETMQHWANQHGIPLQQDSPGHVVSALSNFAEALDKEDTDLDLWLRTASVAAMLGSSRIARFCLEAVLDGNDEAYASLLRLPGLEEGFAGHQLRELVRKLEDTLSLEIPPLAALKKKRLSETLKKRLNPYPWAPVPSEISPPLSQPVERSPQRVILSPLRWDWAGVGDVILRHYMAETNTVIETIQPGCAITLGLPPEATITEPTEDAHVGREIEMTERPKEDNTSEQDQLLAPVDETDKAVKDGEDAVMADRENSKVGEGDSATLVEYGRELSRKRSTDSAGLPETAEGGRARSKRLRARDSEAGLGAEAMGQAVSNTLEDQLWPFTNADKCLREVINDQFERLGVESFGSLEELRNLVSNSTTGAIATDSIDKAACDMYTALRTSGSKIAPVLLSAEPMDLGGASREAGLNAFLGYSKSSTAQACTKPTLQSEKLTPFVQTINDTWLSTQEVAFSWVEALLSPGFHTTTTDSTQCSKSSYIQYRWGDDLKRQVVQVLVNVDEFIYHCMLDRLEAFNCRVLKAQEQAQQYSLSVFDTAQIEMIETIFELHLDVYSLIKHPSSGVNQSTQTEQNDRLTRWISLAREAMQLRSSCQPNVGPLDELSLRHIWASVFQLSVSDEILPQNVLFAMEELKEIRWTYN
jgi:tetratricopeptide (TPR) repeat protein